MNGKKGNVRKVLAAALSMLMLVGLIPLWTAARAADSPYSVTMSEDQKKSVGETAVVKVTVNSETETTYHTLDVTLDYDPGVLVLDSKTVEGFSVRSGEGTVRVLRYGAEMEVGSGFELTFTCAAAGVAEVKLSSAKVDHSRNAETQDAPPAQIADGTTVVTVGGKEPAFKVHSLVLSGNIGVNFFLDLPEIEGVDYADSYMEFTVSGKGGRTTVDPYDPSFRNASGKYYGFTCYVWSIQMADTITATFHYGDGKTVSETYSIEHYFQAFEQHAAGADAETAKLIHAIADYGHYMQIYLSDVNKWNLGTDYAALTRHYTDSYDYADILSTVEPEAIVRTLNGTNVEKANYRLQLGSGTTLDVYLKTKDGAAPTNVTVTVAEAAGGKTTTTAVTPVKQADGRYLVSVPDISAHRLGDRITVAGNAGGTFRVEVSPLSFVRDVLKNETGTKSRDALSSLYAYYAAAIEYKQKH